MPHSRRWITLPWVAPWIVAAILLAIAWPTALEELAVSPAEAPFLGLLAAGPIVVVLSYPLRGWAVSAVGALALPLLVVPGPGHHWAWQVVHVLVLFALLLAVGICARPWAVALAAAGTSLVFLVGLRSGEGALWAFVCVPIIVLFALLIRRLLTSRRELARQEEVGEAERARRAMLEERARIARDLHDVLAHSMSMVVVQAETARYRIPGVGEEAAAEFTAVAATARAALGEVRSVLGVLRADDADEPEHRPQPGLDDVDALLAAATRAGVDLSVEVTGDEHRALVGPGAAVSLHRVLQESLTNASRHASGSPVAVTVEFSAEAVRARVRNGPGGTVRAPGPGAAGSGLGLPGMRERAAAVGGELTAGRTPDDGFEVTLVLPSALSRTS